MQVGIIMGSQSDLEVVRESVEVLRQFKVSADVKILSAHRTPGELSTYVKKAVSSGVKVFICAAGFSAALPGVVASHTSVPVIGIPLENSSLKGLDALLSIVQMPGGVPVACMSIGKAGAKNAALFAVQILALSDARLRSQLSAYKKEMARKVIKAKVNL